MEVDLKENISKKFLLAVESRKSEKTVDAVDNAMNVEEHEQAEEKEKVEEFYMNGELYMWEVQWVIQQIKIHRTVPTDADRLKQCLVFQEKRIDDITKVLIKEKRPPGSKFASLKRIFKNGKCETCV